MKKTYIVLSLLCFISNITATTTTTTTTNQSNKAVKLFAHNMLKISSPFAAVITNNDKGFGHFMVIYKQSVFASSAMKFWSEKNKWEIGKRPVGSFYNGMPSGHTVAAWAPAAYVRTFSKDHKYLSIPLYASAVAMAYSRVERKYHTVPQVITGALLVEAITYANSKLSWSKDYSPIDVSIDKQSGFFNFNFNFNF
tara:strand:- start:3715 stop:4302 length:588 start_codon:yes stop_codon:yes gene_type:complete